jgi:hypothetical protein
MVGSPIERAAIQILFLVKRYEIWLQEATGGSEEALYFGIILFARKVQS